MQLSTPSSGFLDLSLVFAVGQYEPQVLTDEFLKAKSIIPSDWELAKPVETTPRQIELRFKNGVCITGQSGAIRWMESMVGKTPDTLAIPGIARQFAAAVPSLGYRSVDINLRRYVTFADRQAGARHFIYKALLTPHAWQSVGNAPVRASIDLGFTLEQCLLRVNIQEGRLQLPEQEPISAVLFMGNYQYAIQGDAEAARLAKVDQALGNLSENLANFQALVDDQFLGQEYAQKESQLVA